METKEENDSREIVRNFLVLPWRHQMTIAKSLGLLTQDDMELSDEDLLRLIFRRAAEQDLIARLRDETNRITVETLSAD